MLLTRTSISAGILKNPITKPASPPPVSPHKATADGEEAPKTPLTPKELTIHNTQINAGHRRSSSGPRPGAPSSRRQSASRASGEGGVDGADGAGQRLKWDEANLYLAEQERTATMKITEPKTPYAKHYDPAEDPSDVEEDGDKIDLNRVDAALGGPAGDIPAMSLGEPEEAVPEHGFGASRARKSKKGPRSGRAVHVDDSGSGRESGVDDDDNMVGMSAEEREKHRRFEEMRKKHYEMKNVAHLLGHPEDLDNIDDDDDEANGAAK